MNTRRVLSISSNEDTSAVVFERKTNGTHVISFVKWSKEGKLTFEVSELGYIHKWPFSRET